MQEWARPAQTRPGGVQASKQVSDLPRRPPLLLLVDIRRHEARTTGTERKIIERPRSSRLAKLTKLDNDEEEEADDDD